MNYVGQPIKDSIFKRKYKDYLMISLRVATLFFSNTLRI
ncbi:hypothetical protein HME9304_01100 [Flagellimonas maritima]|uniref:Uncharacterized protein n=1 Tax=Flagellimonas maritima TaxID=1383885 RepID=A0A2Z4LQT7_9FLAO|nr:hypothetical protein HME9304_01100 [Allomuricauda aurantiaca]